MTTDANWTLNCPACGKPFSATVLAAQEVEIPGEPHVQGWPLRSRFAILLCPNCSQPAFAYKEMVGSLNDRDVWDAPFVLWPPQDRPLSIAVPPDVRLTFEEARTCFRAKAYVAAVVMVRRAVEGVCHEHGVTTGDLKSLLKKLLEKKIIDDRLHKWADSLRDLGNRGAHYAKDPVTRQDAEDALAFSEALLDYIYVLAAKFAEFEKRQVKAGP